MSDADVAVMLTQVMNRLDAIEARLDALAQPPVTAALATPEVTALVQVISDNHETYTKLLRLLAQAPQAMEFLGEFVTTVLTQTDDDGLSMEARIQESLTLFRRVTNPEVMGQLHLALDLLESAPETYGEVISSVQGLVDHVLSMDPLVTARIDEGMQLLELVSRPHVTGLARRGMALVDRHFDTMTDLLETAELSMARLETSGLDPKALSLDGLDLLEKAATAENIALAHQGLDLLARLNGSRERLLQLTEAVLTPDTLAAMQRITASGMLDPAVLQVLEGLGEALLASVQQPPTPVGVFGALGAMTDHDTKLALGFGLTVAGRLGAQLKGAEIARG